MVGGALVAAAQAAGGYEIITATRKEVNLLDQAQTYDFLARSKPDLAIIAAAKVGGIIANSTYPADFIHDNLAIALNTIEGSRKAGVGRLLFLGSSCIYPKLATQPLSESALLTGPLEPTNEAYAVAKIAGLKLCQFYREQHGLTYHSAMPTNLYGPGDNYHPQNSHVIPGMLGRFHAAKLANAPSVTIFGTGTPLREFLHVTDLAAGCLHLLEMDSPPDLVNIGSGSEVTILELAQLVAATVGYNGEILTDPSKPETARRARSWTATCCAPKAGHRRFPWRKD